MYKARHLNSYCSFFISVVLELLFQYIEYILELSPMASTPVVQFLPGHMDKQ